MKMNVQVFSASGAARYNPTPEEQPVYLIRIYNHPRVMAECDYPALEYEDRFKVIKIYHIDDIQPHSQVVFDYERLMTTELATTILTDFQQDRGDCKTLAVHCQAGRSRSPAVALALAELFQLLSPAELQQLRERHRYHNAFVYETLRKAFADLLTHLTQGVVIN